MAADHQKLAQQPVSHVDIRHIVRDAKSRWLRPTEICEVLRNYEEAKLKTSPSPPYQPPSGSLFLFDRKALRYFRKDGHNWRKKKDGKTVKEAHERLKVGSVNMLHCYYAHGEENPNFQRRSYWLLEGAHEHIVLVHYLEALQGNKTSVFRLHDHSLERQFNVLSKQAPEPNGANSPASLDAEDDDDVQVVEDASRRPCSLSEQLQGNDQKAQHSPQDVKDQQTGNANYLSEAELTEILDISDMNNAAVPEEGTEDWKDFLEKHSDNVASNAVNFGTWEEVLEHCNVPDECDKYLSSLPEQSLEVTDEAAYETPCSSSDSQKNQLVAHDSFGRWIMDDIRMDKRTPTSDSDALLSSTFEESDTGISYQESILNIHMFDQKFKIVDYSPDWSYAFEETKVLVTGEFFIKPDGQRWCCMFGENEVPAEVLSSSVLRCKAPSHPPGIVPFYITCTDRTACSEIRDFEFRKREETSTPLNTAHDVSDELLLRLKLARMLASEGTKTTNTVKDPFFNKVRSYFRRTPEEWDSIITSIKEKSASVIDIKDRIFETFSHLKLQEWLIAHMGQDKKGPCVYDKDGQGLLHIVSALGFEWAIAPILAAGVGVNFRDSHGWTALHWAAYYGRENVVLSLFAAKAVPELLTDPTPSYSNGQTPADIASSRGYAGLAGYLAEASLQHHLSVLTLKDDNLNPIHFTNASLSAENAANTMLSEVHSEDESSLKQSLTAVRRATQAAALIQSAFRQFSFRKNREMEEASLLQDVSYENLEDLMAAQKIQRAYRGHKTRKLNSAATKIQSKFRSWKGRQDFINTRQRIIKIQAHVRGYQARKEYQKILWSVGVLEKLVLRWHRGRHGLRGFHKDDMVEDEADDAFFKEGRRQKEHVIESAVGCVQAMVYSPEARAQYARLRAGSEGLKLEYDDVEDDMS